MQDLPLTTFTNASEMVDQVNRVTNAINSIINSNTFVNAASQFSGAVQTNSPGTVVTLDNNTPTIAEGDQYFSLVYTAANASNTLEITAPLMVSASGACTITALLFANNTLVTAQSQQITTSNQVVDLNLFYSLPAGSTQAVTYTVRIGPSSGVTSVTLNGSNGTQRFNGFANSGIRIKEFTI